MHSLTSVAIPESVVSIEDNAFYDCGSLTSITIPTSATFLGENVFQGCSSLVQSLFQKALNAYRVHSMKEW